VQHNINSKTIGLPELKSLVLNLRKISPENTNPKPPSRLSTSSLGVLVGRSLRLKHTALKLLKSYPKKKSFNRTEVDEFLQKVFTSCGLECPASISYPENMIG